MSKFLFFVLFFVSESISNYDLTVIPKYIYRSKKKSKDQIFKLSCDYVMNVDDINDGSGTPKIGFSGTLNQWIELKLNKDILHFFPKFCHIWWSFKFPQRLRHPPHWKITKYEKHNGKETTKSLLKLALRNSFHGTSKTRISGTRTRLITSWYHITYSEVNEPFHVIK